MSHKDKTIVVTGGSRALGLGLVEKAAPTKGEKR
jgi:NAD(P)-dependent dehydrogenase (short-subunit alcohol dehydrogenase family)